jgi:hypothetical protein
MVELGNSGGKGGYQGGDGTHPPAHAGGQGPGYFHPGQGVSNFVGPRYGLPGYKESHAWEAGVDMFSGVALNFDFYRAKYGLDGSHETVQLDWLDKLDKNIPPNCPEGRLDWDLNKYAENNPAVASVKDDSYNDVPATCKQLLKSYLSVGIYEGLTGQTGFEITKDGVEEGGVVGPPSVMFKLNAGLNTLKGQNAQTEVSEMRPELTFSYTFWIKVTARKSLESNIMSFNTPDGQAMPTVALGMPASSTDLIMTVAQSDSPDYNCEATGSVFTEIQPGYLEIGRWHYIAMVAEKYHSSASKVILYVDGEVACEKDNTAGTTVEPADNGLLFFSDPAKNAADADVALIHMYPGRAISAAEVAVQMEIEGNHDLLSMGPDMGGKGARRGML